VYASWTGDHNRIIAVVKRADQTLNSIHQDSVAMKWYFALSESSLDRHDHDWRGLTFAAVRSAQRNTTLEPHLIYDGEENAFISALRSMRVIQRQ
jgi:hypothetical protein